MSDEIYLIYKGGGSIQGVPARNMTYEEAKQFDVLHLVMTGLYIIKSYDIQPESIPAPLKRRRTKKESE